MRVGLCLLGFPTGLHSCSLGRSVSGTVSKPRLCVILLLRDKGSCAGEGKALVADPSDSTAAADAASSLGSVPTPEDKESILGNRPMDPNVPEAWMIESKSIRSQCEHPLVLLMVVPFLQVLGLLL